jgi:K(+)-stimulated pyrophosphate-energized sodium pump
MSNANYAWAMSPQSFRAYNRWHAIIGLLLALLLLLLPWWTNGRIGPHGWQACSVPAAPAASMAPPPAAAVPPAPPVVSEPVVPAAAPPAVVAAVPAAAVAAVAPAEPPPAMRIFFRVNKANLPDDVDATMKDMLAYLKAHPGAKAVVSGFHDEKGGADSQANQLLAQRRARAVADVLSGAGVAVDRIVMSKPSVTAGSGSPAEARRVEVSVQP